MEDYKVQNFGRDFPDVILSIKTLDAKSVQEQTSIALQKNNLSINKINDLQKNMMFLCNLEDKTHQCLDRFHTFKMKRIIVCNLNYDTGFSIDINQFINYFEYIWYPGTDDILLFNSNYVPLYFIDHNGNLYVGHDL